MIKNSLAIVLNKSEYKETSLIVTFYTKDFGKITGLVKGARRPGKYNSKFDLFSLNEIVFYEKSSNSFNIISECNLVKSYQDIRKDIHKTSYGIYFIELINLATERQDTNVSLFNLFLETFDLLNKGSDLEKISRIFEVQLLHFSGLMPRIEKCLSCGGEVHADAWFSKKLGGLLCKGCRVKDFEAIRLLKGTTLSINRLANDNVFFLERLKFANEVSLQLKNILSEFLSYHFESQTKSVKFLRQLEEMKV